MFRRLTLMAIIALLATLAFGGYLQYQRWHTAALPLPATGARVEVPAGQPLDRLANRLAAEGLIEHAWDLKLLARLRGDAARVQAGEYEFEPGLTLAGMLDQLVSGRVKLYALTIVEGTTLAFLLRELEAHEAIRQTLEKTDPQAIATLLDLPAKHAEGWFLPETYHFPRGTSDVEFLRRATAAMQRALESEWEQRAEGLPIKTPYEALILASIIEKETAVESERTRIAGVFTRRLRKGMRLETDPTVIYGLGADYDGDLRFRDMRSDTPYNTYRRKGLPPTPIALPSCESVYAALHPAPGDELYFVARGPGKEHIFSATYDEHRRAVREYQMRRRPLEEPETER